MVGQIAFLLMVAALKLYASPRGMNRAGNPEVCTEFRFWFILNDVVGGGWRWVEVEVGGGRGFVA